MKTLNYNPSPIEVKIAQAIKSLGENLQEKIGDHEIINIENKIDEDNPMVKLFLLDNDGDPHEVVLKIIQLPDKF